MTEDEQRTYEPGESEVFRRKTVEHEAVRAEEDESIWWVAALIGLGLAGVGGFVFYETMQLLAANITAWANCLLSEGGALFTCNDALAQDEAYRFGVNVYIALVGALVALFVGPVPLIVALNRYRNNIAAAALFFALMIPYGTLAFLVIVIGALAAIFYLIQFP